MPTHTNFPHRNLDSMRALAVLAVLVTHTITARGPAGGSVHLLGQVGVYTFFVHTALVLMGSLERLTGGAPSGDLSWVRTFYTQRAFRIYPLVWVLLIVCVVGYVPTSTTIGVPVVTDHAWRTVVSNAALVQNLVRQENVISVLWSLPLEVQMYVLLPLCFLVALKGTRAVWMVLGVATIAAYGTVEALRLDLPLVGRLAIGQFFPCFLSGVLAYAGLRARTSQRQAPAVVWVLAVLVLGAGLIGFVAVANVTYYIIPAWFYCMALGLLIPRMPEARPGVIPKIGATIAKYSFGIYLFHVPALFVAFDVLKSQPVLVQWVTFGALVVSVPVLAFHFVEDPCVQLGKRLTARRATVAAALPLKVAA